MAVDLAQLGDDLRAVTRLWCDRLGESSKRKEQDFGRWGRLCEKFYSNPTHDFIYQGTSGLDIATGLGDLPGWMPKVTTNLFFQMVDVFLPYLHHRNPTRLITDKRIAVPPEILLALIPMEVIQQAAMQAQMTGQPFDPLSLVPQDVQKEAMRTIRRMMLEGYQNYTPEELNLQEESHKSLVDALVMGRGIWWTTLVDTPRGRLVGTEHDSIDHFQLDPDFDDPKKSLWMSRERWEPHWVLEDRFGHPRNSLKEDGTNRFDTAVSKYDIKIEGSDQRRDKPDGTNTSDMVRYFEIYSRCGLGGRLAGAEEGLQERLASAGENVFLAIAPNQPFPLNFSPEHFKVDDARLDDAVQGVLDGLQWHTPFHRDPYWKWPCALLDFHHLRHSSWPLAHGRPAIGEQIMVNWIWSHVAGKIKRLTRDKWAYPLNMDPDALEKFMSSLDDEWIGVKVPPGSNMSIRDMIVRIEAGDLNKDLFELAMHYSREFQLRTGVFELLSGGGTARQIRSSYEAQLQEKYSESRPRSMADRYDACQKQIAKNEGIATRYHIDAKSIAPFFGEQASFDGSLPQIGMYSQLWQQCVYSQDIDSIVSDDDYRIEPSSMRKPNTQELLAAMNESAQYIVQPMFQVYFMTGNPSEVNKWYKALCKHAQIPEIQFPDLSQQIAMQQQAQQEPPPDEGGHEPGTLPKAA